MSKHKRQEGPRCKGKLQSSLTNLWRRSPLLSSSAFRHGSLMDHQRRAGEEVLLLDLGFVDGIPCILLVRMSTYAASWALLAVAFRTTPLVSLPAATLAWRPRATWHPLSLGGLRRASSRPPSPCRPLSPSLWLEALIASPRMWEGRGHRWEKGRCVH